MARKKRSPELLAQMLLNNAACVGAGPSAYSVNSVTQLEADFCIGLDEIYDRFCSRGDDLRRGALVARLAPALDGAPHSAIAAHFASEPFGVSKSRQYKDVYDSRIRVTRQTAESLSAQLPPDSPMKTEVFHLLGLHPLGESSPGARRALLGWLQEQLPLEMRALSLRQLTDEYLSLSKRLASKLGGHEALDESTCFRYLLVLATPGTPEDVIAALEHDFGVHPLEHCPADQILHLCRALLPRLTGALHEKHGYPLPLSYQTFWAKLYLLLETRDKARHCRFRPQLVHRPDREELETLCAACADVLPAGAQTILKGGDAHD